jgi:hypothetical protein
LTFSPAIEECRSISGNRNLEGELEEVFRLPQELYFPSGRELRMAIPVFGFRKIEVLACALMVVAGVAGLLLTLTGSLVWIAGALPDHAWPRYVLGGVRPLWLVLQSLAVTGGGIGAWRSTSFLLAALGVAASLVVTPVGFISFLPGMLMLLLIVSRRRAFNVFLPRWKGPGRPPPGAWRN